jgi:GT2 family glycosyltransferase
MPKTETKPYESNQPPLVSVVILNWNGLSNTKACLESVFKADYPNVEVVVVDNGSADGSKEYLRGRKDIVLVDNARNRGFTGGHIDGLRASRGKYVMLLNNDAVVKPDIISQALRHFDDDKVFAVGGRAYQWDEKFKAYNESNPFYSYLEVSPKTAEGLFRQSDDGRVKEVNGVSGSCVVVRRSMVDEIGYLYDRFFAYYEETDLFARAKRAGYRVLYDPAVQIWHLNGASTAGRRAMFYYLLFRNRVIFAVRNFDQPFLAQFWRQHIKMAAKSALRYLLRRDPLEAGYVRAAVGSLWHLPAAYRSRKQLLKQFGGGYSRKIITENEDQVSVVVDCRSSTDCLGETLKNLDGQGLPVTDVVAVLSSKTKGQTLPRHPYLRTVSDTGMFDTHFENFGLIVARCPYVLSLESGQKLPAKALEQLLYELLAGQAQISYPSPEGRQWTLSALAAQNRIGELYLAKRQALADVGGYEPKLGRKDSHHRILTAASAFGLKLVPVEMDPLATASESKALTPEDVALLLHRGRMFKRARSRSRRMRQLLLAELLRRRAVYWPYILLRWGLDRDIRLRAKAGRLKALLLAGVRGKTRDAIIQLKHMRNEFIVVEGKRMRAAAPQTGFVATETPIFVVCRDRLSPLQQLVAWLETAGYRRIVMIDNASTYPPLLEYFDKTPYQVLQLGQNIGHTSPWDNFAVPVLARDAYYVVTDPDVIPTEDCPTDVLEYFHRLLQQFPAFSKVGLGLKIDDLPAHYVLRDQVVKWEKQFWQQEVADGVYEAGVDTTFALYRPRTAYFLHPSLRTGEPYVARHLPWYNDSQSLSEEDRYYRQHVQVSVNSWDTDALPERYAKEMAKQALGKKPSGA